jgi:glycosyltransferase involved in cell wall biosynthesis
MPVISIIVPVYKVEAYLRRCIDSILAQTFTDFECILVDDGSPDACPAICDEYAKQDNRIMVIHQENKGVSAARNAGLDIAKGEWIGFVDSDDWCDEKMFRFLYDNAVKYDVDVSICGVQKVSSDGYISTNTQKKVKLLCSGITAIHVMFTGKLFRTGPYAKLIKASIFIKNKIRYDILIKYGEDALLLYELFKCTNAVFFESMRYYKYFLHPYSITGSQVLPEARKTVFMAYDKMLLSETNKKIRIAVKTRKTQEACAVARYYLFNNDCLSDSYLFLRDIIKRNFVYVLVSNISLKSKIYCLIVLYPKLWHLLHNFDFVR